MYVRVCARARVHVCVCVFFLPKDPFVQNLFIFTTADVTCCVASLKHLSEHHFSIGFSDPTGPLSSFELFESRISRCEKSCILHYSL